MTHLEVRSNGQQRSFVLGASPVIIGRQRESDLMLELEAVSRRHARIVPVGDGYAIEDFGSRNGTFVNGTRVATTTKLRDGDVIVICDAELVFRDAAPASAGAVDLQVTLIDGALAPGAQISTMSASAAQQHSVLRPEDALRAVRRVTTLLTQRLDLNALLSRVLDVVLEIYPQADRGVVMLLDDAGELVPVASRARAGKGGALAVSRTVLRRAIERKEAILSTNAATDVQFEPSQSLLSMPIHSLMCVPLVTQTDVAFGVIEVHAESERARFTPETLDLLLSVARTTAVAVENTRLHERLLTQDRLERDLEHARAVQKSFLPAGAPRIAGYEFFAYYESADSVGGDYYGFIELPGNRLAIGVADVSGKGMSAALMMARLSSDVRFALLQTQDPAAALIAVNASLSESGLDDRFVSMVLMVLESDTHRLRVANAGHPPPLLRRADGSIEPIRGARVGLPLNVSADPALQALTASVDLAPGDVVLAYTDGVSEAMNRSREQFEEQRIVAALSAAPAGAPAVGQRLIEAVQAFTVGCPQADDTTVVCLGRTGP